MKYIITQKNIYEIIAEDKESAIKMMKATVPSSSISVEEMKEAPNYSDLINMMSDIKNITCDKVENMLNKIKNELTQRIAALYKLLCEAKTNGLRVNDYLRYPTRDYDFGFSSGALVFKTGDSFPQSVYIFVDYKGDVYTSDYSVRYQDNNKTFCDTFKMGKGSSSNEEWNQKKLQYLTKIYEKFTTFEKEVIDDIKIQIEYKKTHNN